MRGDTSVELDNEHNGYLGPLAPEECTERGYGIPHDDEKGWWSATRMSANNRDVVIDSVRYEILDDRYGEATAEAGCAIIDHRVAVYIGGAAPSETPTLLFETLVTDLVADPDLDSQVIEVDMPPLTLQAGEYLYVFVELEVNEQGERICNLLCKAPEAGDSAFFSGSDSTPYTWKTLTSFGLPDAALGMWAHIED